MWTVEFTQDTDTPGVGTVSATNGVVNIRDRVDTNSTDSVNIFINKCSVLAEEEECKRTQCIQIASTIATLLNGG